MRYLTPLLLVACTAQSPAEPFASTEAPDGAAAVDLATGADLALAPVVPDLSPLPDLAPAAPDLILCLAPRAKCQGASECCGLPCTVKGSDGRCCASLYDPCSNAGDCCDHENNYKHKCEILSDKGGQPLHGGKTVCCIVGADC